MLDEVLINRRFFGRLQGEAKMIDAAWRVGTCGMDKGDIHIAIRYPHRTSGVGRRFDRRIIEFSFHAEDLDIERRKPFGIVGVYCDVTDHGHSWFLCLINIYKVLVLSRE